jgi:hypothetical protein
LSFAGQGKAGDGRRPVQYWHHVALIRRILLRMRSWQNYIFMEGH